MASASSETAVAVEPLTGTIGAVVSGVDLAEPQTDAEMARIETALHEHGVLFFRDQRLDDESHLRFGRWLGELHVHHSGRNLTAHPEIRLIEGSGRDIDWHADITFEECPARASVLRAVTLPAVGGDTIWTSTCAAYDELSSAMQRFVDGLHATHDSSSHNRRDPHLEILRAVHPVVIDHPWTGRRSIFVNPGFTRDVVELSPMESRRVLQLLHERIQAPGHQVRWRWAPGDVAMWDNLATQHFVVGDYVGPRTMLRVTVRGPRPSSSRVDRSTDTVS